MTQAGSPQGIVEALIALGLAPPDARRCVHVMQERDSLVLLCMHRPGEPLLPEAPVSIDMDDIAEAVAHGAVWARPDPRLSHYLRRVDWGSEDLEQFRQELERLSLLQPLG